MDHPLTVQSISPAFKAWRDVVRTAIRKMRRMLDTRMSLRGFFGSSAEVFLKEKGAVSELLGFEMRDFFCPEIFSCFQDPGQICASLGGHREDKKKPSQ